MSAPNTEEKSEVKSIGKVVDGIRVGNAMQTRFRLIPNEHLSRETVAGIQDMSLFKLRSRKPPVGATVRFDRGLKSSPHINIDPLGKAAKSNPHISVPKGVIKTAEIVNKTLKYVGPVVTVAAVAFDSYRVYSAFKNDDYIKEHADEIIKEMEDIIEKLKLQLKVETDQVKRKEIQEEIEKYENFLNDVKRIKKVRVKTIKTVSSIAGGWGVGAAGGCGGAWAGAGAGATIGSFFGPIGTVVGTPIGAVIGAIGGGIAGNSVGSSLGETVAEEGLKTFVDN
ncbi:unnamed protein product [Heterotrigona itama]|uniref:Uncharacterized protein n=1 Tax=Heterotrigona itama TaxID=395501 RepID=A0A6V7GYR7_9HYME|nr:unnamed protein product [Heterotrigona itama]